MIPLEIAIEIVKMTDHISGYNFLEAIGMDRKEIVEEMRRFVKIFIYDGSENVPDDCEFCYVDDSVKRIGRMVFANHIDIQSVRLPDDITRIVPGTFCGCYSLKHIKLPKNLVSIGQLGFGSCYSLKEITIPKNVKDIKTHAFSACVNLEVINMKCEKPNLGTFAFSGSPKVPYRFIAACAK